MTKFKKILIVGDSFCADREFPTDWPTRLATLLGVELLGKGFGGCSWWTVKQYIENLQPDKDTLLLICHTAAVRLPNDYQLPINFNTLEHAKKVNSKNIDLHNLGYEFYTSELFSKSFYNWAHAAWLNELDSMSGYFNVVHVPCFDLFDATLVNHGMVILPPDPMGCLFDVVKKFGHPRIYRNHFTQENNKLFATSIANILSNVNEETQGIYRFDLDGWV